MPRTLDLREVVARRSRDIAEAAHRRATAGAAEGEVPPGSGPEAPPWLRRVARWIPEPVRDTLRAALTDESELRRLNRLIERLGREKEALQHQSAAVSGARRDLQQAERRLEDERREIQGQIRALEARQAEADRALARARRAAAETAVERRVPLDAIAWSPEDSPRPLRAIGRLGANLRRFGQLTPITVTLVDPEDDPLSPAQGYTVISGHRRMAALEQIRATHALIRVVQGTSPELLAALPVAENCMVDGVSTNAVRHLAEQLEGEGPLRAVLDAVLADDAAVEEDVFLEDMAEEALHHLAEGAAWVAELRPYWADLDEAAAPLESLIIYFARVAARLSR